MRDAARLPSSGQNPLLAKFPARRENTGNFLSGVRNWPVRLWQALTGGSARHAVTGRSFDDLAREAEVANGA
jgi:hypothetical protein